MICIGQDQAQKSIGKNNANYHGNDQKGTIKSYWCDASDTYQINQGQRDFAGRSLD